MDGFRLTTFLSIPTEFFPDDILGINNAAERRTPFCRVGADKHPATVYMMLLRVHLLRPNNHTSTRETAEARQAINGIFTRAGSPVHPAKSTKS